MYQPETINIQPIHLFFWISSWTKTIIESQSTYTSSSLGHRGTLDRCTFSYHPEGSKCEAPPTESDDDVSSYLLHVLTIGFVGVPHGMPPISAYGNWVFCRFPMICALNTRFMPVPRACVSSYRSWAQICSDAFCRSTPAVMADATC